MVILMAKLDKRKEDKRYKDINGNRDLKNPIKKTIRPKKKKYDPPVHILPVYGKSSWIWIGFKVLKFYQ